MIHYTVHYLIKNIRISAESERCNKGTEVIASTELIKCI